MSTKQQEKRQPTDNEKKAHAHFEVLIGDQVIHLLGQPIGIHSVQVRKVWDDHYRVNVYVGDGPVGAKVAHSFFLAIDTGGNILASTPPIKKLY